MVHVQALVNVPAIPERSIRSDIATCKTTPDSQIQVYTFLDCMFIHTHIVNRIVKLTVCIS